ncbi:5-methyltetrahydropteroyltriglutamate--homocysteine S-methyltransferase [Burkholderia ubonensis]|uniref:5-methyltetrahydropteroyltriglutamate--homocysteine methyltransferase n=1 Tax=Burkholderia ubonensis TaxID=101571 RepID=A0A107F9R7_9BURK|nr:5-methyltetrahydropteroyltriglutamate--homocysteine S-methyltransferase [Burkholderia ubonensis]KWD88484.1 5-methyltetrahydropteroyltriglutamate--homocysteine methyltransferase [Burkholderia ubonensis]KWD88806.1 5-methyltetrahydropteroyltriglutamate--homocysteine methyltransferase [Burkholderia ubonensis]KWD89565.1 5-methyltetrahydropteroyltriglutamate--homocysteine methyltransferase [Burkholderia ubonensis]KWD94571.1 5-methyltetrahydropteroyltriglutamate--homocysteine methyltransferase [Bur
MSTAHVLGFPRIGAQRELKFALERYWRDGQGADAERALVDTGVSLRAAHWAAQRDAGLDWVTVGDFAWYDHVLTTLAHVGGLPARFGFDARKLSLADYFAAARGNVAQPAMEMTKWFDTNYHYLVPEYSPSTTFGAGVEWQFDEVREAQALGHPVKVALVGPLTLLWLGKARDGLADRLSLLPRLLPAYQALLARLKADGVEWVQIDEPIFALDLPGAWRDAAPAAYAELVAHAPRVLLATYFESVDAHATLLKSLPVAGLHVDLVRGDAQLDAILAGYPADKVLSCGIVDGRNVWRNDLDRSLARLAAARAQLGERLWIATSCSLLHAPVDLGNEPKLDAELKQWLAFAVQKAREVAVLRDAFVKGREVVAGELDASRAAAQARRTSTRIHNPLVQRRVAALTDADARRAARYDERARRQRARFQLPLLPTTTIGSFPQTAEIRKARADFKAGALDHLGYLEAMREQIRIAIGKQAQYGLDVYVHGEAERNDMVEYFGELLWGFAITANGWVQSYGSRCVKPPLIYGDVFLPEAMTVGWAQYAQGLTDKPVKGMLTGPVTMLQWSFVRDDQPRATTALQIALALRQETVDLERAGIGMIQIDEPALREGLPLRERDRAAYLDWAVRAFRVAASGVADDTQIHTHMCYSEFGDILPSIAALDADVISIETTRSNMELLDDFESFAYPNEIGPGVYDIHSPRVPGRDEMVALIERALARIPAERLWVNPDCGLKTRDWREVDAALTAMVEAARIARSRVEAQAPAVPA